jgi:alkaline phosphatase D
MQDVAAAGMATAPAALAHSVHVEVAGLLPRRDYFYQFNMAARRARLAISERHRRPTNCSPSFDLLL